MEIDIRNEEILVNGEAIAFDLPLDAFKRLLGEPRVCREEPDKNYRAYMEERHGKDYFENSMSPVWDDVGIYSHTSTKDALMSFGIVFDNSKKTAPHTPKSVFTGTLKINGEDWLSAVKKGKDMFGNYCKLDLAKFVVFAEYKHKKVSLADCSESDFTLIELTHSYIKG